MRRPENNLSKHLEWLRSSQANVALPKDALGLATYDGPVDEPDRTSDPIVTRQNEDDGIVETAVRSSDSTKSKYWLFLKSGGVWINGFLDIFYGLRLVIQMEHLGQPCPCVGFAEFWISFGLLKK